MKLQKGDIIKITNFHKKGMWNSVAKEVIDLGNTVVSINYYHITRVGKAEYSSCCPNCYYVQMSPDTDLGVHDCTIYSRHLHYSGHHQEPYGSDWEVVGHKAFKTKQLQKLNSL